MFTERSSFFFCLASAWLTSSPRCCQGRKVDRKALSFSPCSCCLLLAFPGVPVKPPPHRGRLSARQGARLFSLDQVMPPLVLNCAFFFQLPPSSCAETLWKPLQIFFLHPHLLISCQGAANKTTASLVSRYAQWSLYAVFGSGTNVQCRTAAHCTKNKRRKHLCTATWGDTARNNQLGFSINTERLKRYWLDSIQSSTSTKATDEILSCGLNLASFCTHLQHTSAVSLSLWDNKQ